jgi:hypothetical protein
MLSDGRSPLCVAALGGVAVGELCRSAGRAMRALIALALLLVVMCGCTSPPRQVQVSEAPLAVTFLYSTNSTSSTDVRGVFRLQNDLGGDVMILGARIERARRSGWEYLSGASMERKWDASPSVSIIYPPGETLFQAWIPATGGPYRLSLSSRPMSSLKQHIMIESEAFRMSAGPPITIDGGDAAGSQRRRATTNDLACRVAGADRIVLTNRFHPQYSGFSYTATAREARRIIRAVSSPPGDQPVIETACDWDLQFWRGTNRLLTVEFGGEVFRHGDLEYLDETGVLERFYHDRAGWH